MSSLFDPPAVHDQPKGGRRLAALSAVAVIAVSWTLLGLAAQDARDAARPSQSLALIYGPNTGPLADTTD